MKTAAASLPFNLKSMVNSAHSSSEYSSTDSQEIISKKSQKQSFSEDEESLIIRMYNLVGERWSLIAGRIPGRSAEEIQKYWSSTYSTTQGSYVPTSHTTRKIRKSN